MSAYPPPPPPTTPSGSVPPAGSQSYPGYPTQGYDARAWKAQTRAQKDFAKAQWRAQRDQLRLQREQLRAQARAARRYSIVGPLFLLGLGTIFLLVETGHLSWNRLGWWYGHWWPLLLIGTGLLLLAEWAINGRRGSLLGGGMVALLIFLGFIGWTTGQMQRHFEWNDESFNSWAPDWTRFWGETHEEDGAPLATAVAADATLLIHNPRGDVSVTGASEDGQVHVTVRKEIRSNGDSDLSRKRDMLQPHFTGSPAALELNVAQTDSGHADLQVTVPKGVTVTVDAVRGAISVAEMHAPVSISGGRGEINLSGVTGPVTAHLRDRNGSLAAHSVTGGVSVDGRGGDVNLSDISGPVAMNGEFFGTTHLERVNGSVAFETFRTHFNAARVDGQLEIESGSRDAPLQGEAIVGPVTLHTRDRVITLDRVQGNVDINNANGSVNLTTVGKLGTVSVQSTRGSVEVSVPAASSFTVNAQTHEGNIENDFGLSNAGGERPVLTGNVGHGGPTVTMMTDDGDVSLRKNGEAALPLLAPVPQAVVSRQPPVSGSPSAPKAPAAPKKTGTPKKPVEAPLPAEPKTN